MNNDKNNGNGSLLPAKYPNGPETKMKTGIVGATGFVGQRFMMLLSEHPWFEIAKIAASPRSAGRAYEEAVSGRWHFDEQLPNQLLTMELEDLSDIASFCAGLDLVFCAVDMPKDEIIKLEEAIAKQEVPVVSNNSANRLMSDVPIIIPEINPQHVDIIDTQKKRLGTNRGFIVCKPNCSIQSYIPPLSALRSFEPEAVIVSTFQAISGAGKTFKTWPEMRENVIPYIGGEEEKSESEPLKVWGKVENQAIIPAEQPTISAHCYRVAVPEGHTAAVSVRFAKAVSREDILSAWSGSSNLAQQWKLPSAPKDFLVYHEEQDRPQPALDVESDGGMAVHLGRLREDPVLDWKFACLSHNTLRGAAGGAVLTAEFLTVTGHILKQ